MSTTDDDSLSEYRNWTPEAQERALERIREIQNSDWRPFYCPNRVCDGKPHGEWGFHHARADQRPPAGSDWLVWACVSGRGSGKTESGSRYTHKVIEKCPRVVLISPTMADMRDTMIEGESGILATARPGFKPQYEPSKRRLTWPNGARGLLLSAEEPERLRGANTGFAWLDEFAVFPDIQSVWDNMLFGLRLGKRPHVLVTTTPRPRQTLKDILADEKTVVSRASTYDNIDNLAPTFAEQIIKRYEGTRIGRQELYAEILSDVEGALWSWDMIEASRAVAEPADYDRIVVAVDPAGSANKKSDETGIVVVGCVGDTAFVMSDRSGRYSPHGWASLTNRLYEEYSADAVVVETNYGAEMVEHTLRSSGVSARLVKVNARRGKALRAEPVVAMYEQGRVKHLGGLAALETEMCLVAGTLIWTDRGQVPIEEVTDSDRVWTRLGWAPVDWAGKTTDAPVLTTVTHSGGEIRCTVWHRIWTQNRGFVPASLVRPSDLLLVDANAPLAAVASPTVAAGTPRWSPATTRADAGCCTGPSGRITTARSRTGSSSTTSTMTRPTTIRATSLPFPTTSIDATMWQKIGADSSRGDLMNALLTPGACGATVSPVLSVATTAVQSSAARTCGRDGAGGPADASIGATEPVYDIKVADGHLHEFFANGVLVHNTEWVPLDPRSPSPNRVDAMVYGVTNVTKAGARASVGSPLRLVR